MAEQGSTLKLIMEKGPREGETLEFRPGSVIRIGRVVRGNTIAVKDAGVSSKHLKIESKSGQWAVTDLDSSNGTVLNGSQLQPLTPSDLSDGDVIKFGEFTSIMVKVEVHGGENSPRRNPRRGRAKEEESIGMAVVAVNRSRRGRSKANLASVGEDCALGLGIGGELGNAVGVVAENRRGRGKPRRGKVGTSELEESLCEIENVEKLENVGTIEVKLGRQVSTRRTRSSKNTENSGQIVGKMTRGGTGRKKNLRGETLECVENKVLGEKEDVEESNLVHEECKMVEESFIEEEIEAVQAEVREDKDVEERGQIGDAPDLEKMTLGEWFDFLELYLPKQIHEETEEMILRMNQRAEQFHDFVLKQKNDKEKGKLAVS